MAVHGRGVQIGNASKVQIDTSAPNVFCTKCANWRHCTKCVKVQTDTPPNDADHCTKCKYKCTKWWGTHRADKCEYGERGSGFLKTKQSRSLHSSICRWSITHIFWVVQEIFRPSRKFEEIISRPFVNRAPFWCPKNIMIAMLPRILWFWGKMLVKEIRFNT